MGRLIRNWLVIGTIFLLFAGVFSGIPINGSSNTWTQSTESDFETGTLENLEIIGTGESAILQLKKETELGTWQQRNLAPAARIGSAMV